MIPQAAWGTWQVLALPTFAATGQVNSMSASTSREPLGMSALPTDVGVKRLWSESPCIHLGLSGGAQGEPQGAERGGLLVQFLRAPV